MALLLATGCLTAQTGVETGTSARHQVLSFKLGLNQLKVLDRNTSSLVYTGRLPSLGIGYEGLENHNRLSGDLQISRGSFFAEAFPERFIRFRNEDIYGHVDSVLVSTRGTNTTARLSLAYSRQIQSSGKVRYDLGAKVADDLYYPQGFVQPGLMNVVSLSPLAQMEYLAGTRSFFTVGVSIPLLALVSRSTYSNTVSQPHDNRIIGFLDQGTRWTSIGSHRQIDLTATVHQRLGSRWRGGLHYNFRLLKDNYPRDLTLTKNELALSLQIVR